MRKIDIKNDCRHIEGDYDEMGCLLLQRVEDLEFKKLSKAIPI
jgi:hypothetical protein